MTSLFLCQKFWKNAEEDTFLKYNRKNTNQRFAETLEAG